MLNIIGEMKDYSIVRVYGVAGAPKTERTKGGHSVTRFPLIIGKEDDKNVVINVQAWNRLSTQFACLIDKGDLVAVDGMLKLNDYWTEKNQRDTFDLVAGFITVQEFHGDRSMTGQMTDDELMNIP